MKSKRKKRIGSFRVVQLTDSASASTLLFVMLGFSVDDGVDDDVESES